VETIIPVAHAAGSAAIDRASGLLFPLIDYGQAIPEDVMTAYRAERDSFGIIGSPALPDGLNMGTRVWHMAQHNPGVMAKATLLPWAQYWAWLRSGLDVVRMLALGARGVLLGRAWAWALAADGQAGVAKMLKLVEAEMRVAMALTGATRIAEIDKTIIAGD
jgi:hypothetical protein